MFLDLFGAPSRVCSSVHLRPPLSMAWAYEARDNVGLHPVVERLVLLWSAKALVALSMDGRPMWRVPGDFTDGVRIIGDLVLTGGGAGDIPAVWTYWDAGSGRKVRGESCTGSIRAVMGDIAIALHSEEPTPEEPRPMRLRAFRLTPGPPEPLWTRRSRDRADGFSNMLACTSEAVYLGVGMHVAACNLRDGHDIWRSPVADLGGDMVLDAHPMVTRNVCVVATKAWTAAFDAMTGRRLWSTPIWGSHAVYGDRVYVIQHDTFYAFDLFDGSLRLRHEIATEMERRGKRKFQYVATHLAASETHVWCGDPFGTLWAIERETGKPEWHHRPKGTTGYMGSVPAISDNRLYIPSFSMDPRFPPSLYCYEARNPAVTEA